MLKDYVFRSIPKRRDRIIETIVVDNIVDVCKSRDDLKPCLPNGIEIVLNGGQKTIADWRSGESIQYKVPENQRLLRGVPNLVQLRYSKRLYVVSICIGISVKATFGVGKVAVIGRVKLCGGLG